MSYPSFIHALGINFVEVSITRVLAEMETRLEHTNGANVVHGGIYMAFADTLGARGAIMNLPDGYVTSTLESKTNFLRGTACIKLLARDIRVLHFEAGKRAHSAIGHVDIHRDDDPEKPHTQRQHMLACELARFSCGLSRHGSIPPSVEGGVAVSTLARCEIFDPNPQPGVLGFCRGTPSRRGDIDPLQACAVSRDLNRNTFFPLERDRERRVADNRQLKQSRLTVFV